jgi:hypothetical protein
VGHPIAAIVEDAAGQQSFGVRPGRLVTIDLCVQPGLDGVE